MIAMSKTLLAALESDETCDLDAIIEDRRSEDFEALRSLLTLDPTVEELHRSKVLYALGRWGEPVVGEAIRGLLPNLDHAGRITAIDALGRLGTENALDDILEYAHDPSVPVRKFVTRALARINTRRARAELSKLERTDSSGYIRSLGSKLLLQGLKGELTAMRTELADLKETVQSLARSDVTIQRSIAAMQRDITVLKDRVVILTAAIDEHHPAHV